MTPKRRVAWAMIAVTVASSIVFVVAPGPAWQGAVEIVVLFALSLLIFAWYCLDARERSFRRGRLQDFGVAGLALVGMPVYLFRTRGAVGGALALGGMLLFYFLLIFLVLLGSILGMLLRVIAGMSIPAT